MSDACDQEMLREREAEKVDSVGSDASSEVDPNKAALVSKVVTDKHAV